MSCSPDKRRTLVRWGAVSPGIRSVGKRSTRPRGRLSGWLIGSMEACVMQILFWWQMDWYLCAAAMLVQWSRNQQPVICIFLKPWENYNAGIFPHKRKNSSQKASDLAGSQKKRTSEKGLRSQTNAKLFVNTHDHTTPIFAALFQFSEAFVLRKTERT